MEVAVGCLVALLVLASRTVGSASESADDKAAAAPAAAVQKVDSGANTTGVVERISAYSAPTGVPRK